MGSKKFDNVDAIKSRNTDSAGDRTVPETELLDQVVSVISNISQGSEDEFSGKLSDDIPDQSGDRGPFNISRIPGSAEGDDDKAAIGRAFQTVKAFIYKDEDEEEEWTALKNKGCGVYFPGQIILPAGSVFITAETNDDDDNQTIYVKELWDQLDPGHSDHSDFNFIANDNGINYQCATLYMDFRGWDPDSDNRELTSSDTGTFLHWAPILNPGLWIDDNDNPPPWNGSSDGPSDKELLMDPPPEVIILGHVIATTRKSYSEGVIPAQVSAVYGSRDEISIDRNVYGHTIKVTGVHGDSPGDDTHQHMFVGDVYGNGTTESPTETGVSIILLGIPNGSELYPDRPLLANRKIQKWKGDSDEHREYVYEAEYPVYSRYAIADEDMTNDDDGSDSTLYSCSILDADGSGTSQTKARRPFGMNIKVGQEGYLLTDKQGENVFMLKSSQLELRDDNPSYPEIGRMWFRTDLDA